MGPKLANKITKPINNEDEIWNNEDLKLQTKSKPNNPLETKKCNCFSW